MEAATLDLIRHQLQDRQVRLRNAISRVGSEGDLVSLLLQVDSALSKLGTGDYARCEICGEHVGEEDLLRNPLLEYCLCELTPEKQQALEDDLNLARRIQVGLLPEPQLSNAAWDAYYRYEPAGVVSGDYCDLWPHPDEPGTLFFAVGDVSGKGVAASLLMSHIQASCRSLLGAGVALSEVATRVNSQLLKTGIRSHYATLVCGRVNELGDGEIVNAGHCPPYVMRSGRIDRVHATGVPIGLLPDQSYVAERLHLEPGACLMMYTDGLTEASAGGEEEYGESRLEYVLARNAGNSVARQLVAAVREDLALFLNGVAPADDLTVLAIRRNG
jgi:sigma-B regulation protein RsbU (phosphoserine phosphatase)